MHENRTPEGSAEHAHIDWAILRLLLDINGQRPLSDAEIACGISIPGSVADSLKRLRKDGLIHRWSDMATASYPAVYFYEITESPPDQQYHDNKAVLERLLVRSRNGEGPLPERTIYQAFGAKKKRRKLRVTDALDRLELAGLIERRGEQAVATEVAKRYAELMGLHHTCQQPSTAQNERKETSMPEDHHPDSERLTLVQRAIILELLRDDHEERWGVAELRAAIGTIQSGTLAAVLEDLEHHGLVVALGDWVLASRSARHIDELGLIGI
jgi:DNA-binding HxlR family transcriptional regulator/predicted transcriptional regulator